MVRALKYPSFMGENITKFNSILENEDVGIDLVELSQLADKFSEDEIDSFRSNHDFLQDYLDDLSPEDLRTKVQRFGQLFLGREFS